MNSRFQRRQSRPQIGAVQWRLLSLIVSVIVVISIVIILFYPRQVTEPDVTTVEPGQALPAATIEERGDAAREIIAQFDGVDGPEKFDQAYSRAQEFRQQGQLADVQLLYFYAAKGGHGPAAFDLATMYDPNHHSSDTSLLDEPDPFQAYKWYKQAEASGHANTGDRLVALQTWTQSAADAGDMNAEQLLLIWE